MSNVLLFLYNRVKLDKLTLMVLAIVNQFGSLLSYGLYVVKSGQCHITIQIGCGGSWVYRDNDNSPTAKRKLIGIQYFTLAGLLFLLE